MAESRVFGPNSLLGPSGRKKDNSPSAVVNATRHPEQSGTPPFRAFPGIPPRCGQPGVNRYLPVKAEDKCEAKACNNKFSNDKFSITEKRVLWKQKVRNEKVGKVLACRLLEKHIDKRLDLFNSVQIEWIGVRDGEDKMSCIVKQGRINFGIIKKEASHDRWFKAYGLDDEKYFRSIYVAAKLLRGMYHQTHVTFNMPKEYLKSYVRKRIEHPVFQAMIMNGTVLTIFFEEDQLQVVLEIVHRSQKYVPREVVAVAQMFKVPTLMETTLGKTTASAVENVSKAVNKAIENDPTVIAKFVGASGMFAKMAAEMTDEPVIAANHLGEVMNKVTQEDPNAVYTMAKSVVNGASCLNEAIKQDPKVVEKIGSATVSYAKLGMFLKKILEPLEWLIDGISSMFSKISSGAVGVWSVVKELFWKGADLIKAAGVKVAAFFQMTGELIKTFVCMICSTIVLYATQSWTNIKDKYAVLTMGLTACTGNIVEVEEEIAVCQGAWDSMLPTVLGLIVSASLGSGRPAETLGIARSSGSIIKDLWESLKDVINAVTERTLGYGVMSDTPKQVLIFVEEYKKLSAKFDFDNLTEDQMQELMNFYDQFSDLRSVLLDSKSNSLRVIAKEMEESFKKVLSKMRNSEIESMVRFFEESDFDKLAISESKALQVLEFEEFFLKHKREMLNSKENSTRTSAKTIESLISRAKKTRKRCVQRATPIVVFFSGSEGVGKSDLMEIVAESVWRKLQVQGFEEGEYDFSEEFTNLQMFSLADNTTYWDGYENQWVVVMNELNNTTNVQKRQDSMSRFQTIVENTELPLNFSDIKDKGVHFMRSRLVMATSNESDLGACGMTMVDALKRRILFPLKVVRQKDKTSKNSMDDCWEFVFNVELFGNVEKQFSSLKRISESLYRKLVEAKKMRSKVSLVFSELTDLIVEVYKIRSVKGEGIVFEKDDLLKTSSYAQAQMLARTGIYEYLWGLPNISQTRLDAEEKGNEANLVVDEEEETEEMGPIEDEKSTLIEDRRTFKEIVEDARNEEYNKLSWHEKLIWHQDRFYSMTFLEYLQTTPAARYVFYAAIGLTSFAISAVAGFFLTKYVIQKNTVNAFGVDSDEFARQSLTIKKPVQAGECVLQKEKEKPNPYLRLANAQMTVTEYVNATQNLMKNSRMINLNYADGDSTPVVVLFGCYNEFASAYHPFCIKRWLSFDIYSEDGSCVVSSVLREQCKLDVKSGRDLVLIRLKEKIIIQNVADIRRKFPEKPIKSCKSTRVVKAFEDRKLKLFYSTGKSVYKNGTMKAKAEMGSIVHVANTTGFYEVEGVMGFAGCCGFPYLSMESEHSAAPILGVHVAQHGSDGICVPMFASDWEDQAQAQMFSQEVTDRVRGLFSDDVVQVTFPNVGEYFSPIKPQQLPLKTKLERSAISASLPEETDKLAPAKLAPFMLDNEYVSPLAKFYTKHEKFKMMAMHPEVYKVWKERKRQFCINYTKEGFVWSMLTIEQAIFGVPGHIDALDGSSSPGFCMSRLTGAKKRSDLWNADIRWIHPILRDEVEIRLKMYESGGVLMKVVADCLKDETRDLERVRVGKTRVFSVDDVVDCVIAKMVMFTWFKWCKDHRGDGLSQIGTNVHGHDWKMVSERVFRFSSERIIGGDLETMDISTQRYLMSVLIQSHKRMWRCKTGSIAYNLMVAVWYNTFSRIHVCQNFAYRVMKGNCSGGWATGFVNSFTCEWYFQMEYYIQAKRAAMCDSNMIAFGDAVSMVVYGDDNVGSVREDVWYFDNVVIAQGMKEHFGVSFTSPSKGEIVDPWLEEPDRIFLCRRFRYKEGVMYAPLELDSLFGMLHWVRKGENSPETQLLQNVEVFARELYHYDELTREYLWRVVQEACEKAGFNISSINRKKYWRQAYVNLGSMLK